MCSNSGHGTLVQVVNGAIPASYILYSYSYLAATTEPVLVFGFETDPGNDLYLDTVSVVEINAPSLQLLNNPSFENSTTAVPGWVVWCSSTCTSGSPQAGATFGTLCYGSTGNCFIANCAGSGIAFVGQSFSTTVGHYYTISFRMKQGGGPTGQTVFYADVY